MNSAVYKFDVFAGSEQAVLLETLSPQTQLDSRTMNSIAVRHFNTSGTNIAVVVGSKHYTSQEYFELIEKEYHRLSEMVVQLGDLQTRKQATIPFRSSNYVYFLFEGDYLVYVGQSTVLPNRIGQHLADKIFDTVATIEVGSAEMTMIEHANIRHHQPKYNQTTLTHEEVFAYVLRRIA